MSSLTDPGEQVGRYQLIELLGRGGMAEVWKARVVGPEGFRRLVALKRPLPELQTQGDFRRMFASEARILSQLHHPNIVGVFDFGEDGGRPFLVMELIDGWTLSKLLRAQRASGPLPPGFAAFVARELCRALAAVHAAVGEDGKKLQLIHRDLSPTNVMLAFDGSVRLLDFGIAKAIEAALDERTRTGVLKGKVAYMSPEQAAGQSLDHRSDQFSLGAVLFELLTGRRLFVGDSDPVLLRQLREESIEAPSSVEPNLPPALDQACAKMLSRDPVLRFASCADAGELLDGIVGSLGWGPLQVAHLLTDLRDQEDAPPPIRPHTGRLDRESPRRALLAWLAGAGLFAVAVAATIRFWPDIPRRSPPAPVQIAAPAPSPASVRCTIESNPPGAQVFAAGSEVSLGRTPLSLPLPRSTRPSRFFLRAPDRSPATVDIIPDGDQRVSIQLTRVTVVHHPPSHPPPNAKQQALQRDIKKGKIVNPFD